MNAKCKVLVRMVRQQLNKDQWDDYNIFWKDLMSPEKGDNVIGLDIHNTGGKVENYDKGELEIKVGTFSSENPISIGKIIADGTIQFNFPKIDLNAMEETHFFSMQKIGRALGMFVCHDKGIVVNTETVEAIEVKNIFSSQNPQNFRLRRRLPHKKAPPLCSDPTAKGGGAFLYGRFWPIFFAPAAGLDSLFYLL